jgi:hypothetical protein
MPLVTEAELGNFLHQPVNVAPAMVAIRMADAWLSSVCSGMPPWPDPVPEDLWSWALELAAMAYSNPTGMTSRTTDEDSRTWDMARRREILNAAAQRYGDGSGSANSSGAPQGSFPVALDWPDPPVIPVGRVW